MYSDCTRLFYHQIECFCLEGLVRDRLSGLCMEPQDTECKNSERSPPMKRQIIKTTLDQTNQSAIKLCPVNETLIAGPGYYWELQCDFESGKLQKDSFWLSKHKQECFCLDGYVRDSDDSGGCVRLIESRCITQVVKQSRANQARALECPKNEVPVEGYFCELTCNAWFEEQCYSNTPEGACKCAKGYARFNGECLSTEETACGISSSMKEKRSIIKRRKAFAINQPTGKQLLTLITSTTLQEPSCCAINETVKKGPGQFAEYRCYSNGVFINYERDLEDGEEGCFCLDGYARTSFEDGNKCVQISDTNCFDSKPRTSKRIGLKFASSVARKRAANRKLADAKSDSDLCSKKPNTMIIWGPGEVCDPNCLAGGILADKCVNFGQGRFYCPCKEGYIYDELADKCLRPEDTKCFDEGNENDGGDDGNDGNEDDDNEDDDDGSSNDDDDEDDDDDSEDDDEGYDEPYKGTLGKSKDSKQKLFTDLSKHNSSISICWFWRNEIRVYGPKTITEFTCQNGTSIIEVPRNGSACTCKNGFLRDSLGGNKCVRQENCLI